MQHLEQVRRNSVPTRNARLGALHAFFNYLASIDPRHIAQAQTILGVPFKRQAFHVAKYLEWDEELKILAGINGRTMKGGRDDALMRLLHNTGMRVPVLVHLGTEALKVFKDLPAEGVLFPYLSRVRANDCATEFGSRCRQLGIKGVTLHSYRNAWAERAKDLWNAGTLCAGGFGAQQQGRASRLHETRPDENPVS